MRLSYSFLAIGLIVVAGANAQNQPESVTLQDVLKRLNALEEQNRELSQEVQSLRQELAASHSQTPQPASQTPQPASPLSADAQPSLDERVTRNEARIEEQSQTKVEASHKLPISITGMLLFNAFSNTNLSAASPGVELLTG